MKKLKHCVIHIGAEKAGSTSIQLFLAINRPLLRSHGFLVPTTSLLDHHRLAAYMLDADRTADVQRWSGITDEDSVVAFRNKFAHDLQQEIAATPDIHSVVFSSEFLQSRIREAPELLRLRALCESIAERTTIIIYLRNQLEMAVSFYSTYLRAGGRRPYVLPEPNDPEEKFFRFYYDFASLAERWAETFGRDNITIRAFHPDTLTGGDVVTDFVTQLEQFGSLSNSRKPPKTNQGLSPAGQSLFLLINQNLPQIAGEPNDLVRNQLIRFLDQSFHGKGTRPTPDQASRFMDFFMRDNERLSSYFSEREFNALRLHKEKFSDAPFLSEPDKKTLLEFGIKLTYLGGFDEKCAAVQQFIHGNKIDRAEAELRTAETLVGGDSKAAYLDSQIFLKKGKTSEALASAETALSRSPNSRHILRHLLTIQDAVRRASASKLTASQ